MQKLVSVSVALILSGHAYAGGHSSNPKDCPTDPSTPASTGGTNITASINPTAIAGALSNANATSSSKSSSSSGASAQQGQQQGQGQIAEGGSATGGTGGQGGAGGKGGSGVGIGGTATGGSGLGGNGGTGGSSDAHSDNAGNSQSISNDYRQAPSVILPMLAVPGCSNGASAGGSTVNGALAGAFVWRSKECKQIQIAQGLQALGMYEGACNILVNTKTYQDMVAMGMPQIACAKLDIIIQPAQPGERMYSQQEVATIVRKAVSK